MAGCCTTRRTCKEPSANTRPRLKIDPDDARARTNLGIALAATKDLQGAIREFQAALKIEPDLVNAHLHLGAVLCNSEMDVEGAIREFQAVLRIKPTDLLAHRNLGIAYGKLGQWDKAIAENSRASELDPSNSSLFQKVATLQAWFAMDKERAETCQRGLDLAKNTTSPETAIDVAKACCVIPSTDKAQLEAVLTLARKAVDLGKNHGDQPFFQMCLGMSLYRSSHFAEADLALIAAIKGGKNAPYMSRTAAFYHAMSLFRQGQPGDARKIATAAASRMKPLPKDEKNPLADNADLDDLILWMTYKEAKALIKFDAIPAALELKPDSTNSWINRGEYHQTLKQWEWVRDVDDFTKSSELDPDDAVLFPKVVTLQAWFAMDRELADTFRRGLNLAKNTTSPETAYHVAKACCLVPSSDKAQLEAVLALARKAVDLGKNHRYLPFFQIALGMSLYRSSHFAEADLALIAAMKGGKTYPQVSRIAAFYHAMSLFR